MHWMLSDDRIQHMAMGSELLVALAGVQASQLTSCVVTFLLKH